jgi:ferric-dicitrate binding protein FerR (iron transport regulator)
MVLQTDESGKIDRYLRGEADEKEKEYVESLFLDGENNAYLRQSLEKNWNSILNENTSNVADISHLLDRIHHDIRKKEALKMKKPLQRFMRVYAKIAAVFLVPIMIAAGFTYTVLTKKLESFSEKNITSQIYAPLGSRVSFNLPDGTMGVLNGGSKLSYSLPFVENRQIKLEGEAWMQVKHDEQHPFTIGAGISTVKVVGTSLNVSIYPNENYIEVVLKEGKVKFTGKTGEKEITMRPSERLIFQKGKIQKSIVDPAKYNGWVDGKLIFRSDPMAEVARRIERWYNVKITLADKSLEKYTFRATFQDDKIEDVLKFLAMTTPIRYKIIPRKFMTDGTFQKEEIIINDKH